MSVWIESPIAGSSTLYPPSPLPITAPRAPEDFYRQGSRLVRLITIRAGGPGNLWRSWLASQMEMQINQLLQLEAGWDGRRALPPRDAAVVSALDILFAVADDLSLSPQVIPLPDGGLQLEWHARMSVEIEIDGTGAAHLLTTDESGSIVHNHELVPGDGVSLGQARDAIHMLSSRLAGAR